MQECFRIIQSEVLEATIKSLAYNEQVRIVTDHHTVRLPLRVNWEVAGDDTPPYCNEKGGTVLNAAILLNGEKPVEVTLERFLSRRWFLTAGIWMFMESLTRLSLCRPQVTLMILLPCRRPAFLPAE